jgi:cytochrome c biogenesis protein CcdA
MSKVENNKLLIPLCFALGVFISVGEFLCTGQIYLATIIFVFKNSEAFNLEAVSYFLIYGIAFVIPLIAITLLIHRGKEVFDVSEIVRDKLHIIKLVNALIFLIFAIIVLFYF